MAEKPTNDVLKARAEAAELLGLGDNPERLCASDRLRVDLVVTLRAAIDHAAQSLVDGDGGGADLGRLISATESLTKLLPKAATEPVSHRSDPREELLRTYLQMRARGALAGEGYDGLQLENERLSAEVAGLEARLAGKSEHSDIPMVVERVPAPAAKNVVPLKPSSAPAAPAYDYDANSDWKSYVNSDGSIRSTPRGGGHDWGPV
jgi:hypothetical protein